MHHQLQGRRGRACFLALFRTSEDGFELQPGKTESRWGKPNVLGQEHWAHCREGAGMAASWRSCLLAREHLSAGMDPRCLHHPKQQAGSPCMKDGVWLPLGCPPHHGLLAGPASLSPGLPAKESILLKPQKFCTALHMQTCNTPLQTCISLYPSFYPSHINLHPFLHLFLHLSSANQHFSFSPSQTLRFSSIPSIQTCIFPVRA